MSLLKIGGLNDATPNRGDQYLERIARECIECKDQVCHIIAAETQNFDLAEEAVDRAIPRVIKYALRHGLEKEIISGKAFLLTTARNEVKDIQSRKLKADKVETVSWDDRQNEGLLNRAVDSSAKKIEASIAIDESVKIALRDATKEEKQLFEMLYNDDLKVTEIAKCLNISVGLASYRIKKLNALLRAAATQ